MKSAYARLAPVVRKICIGRYTYCMKNRTFTLALIILLACQAAPSFAADDWVDDEEVHGFYKRGVEHSPADDYETAPGQVSGGGDDYQQQMPSELGGPDPNFGLNQSQFNQGTMPFSPGNGGAPNRPFQAPQPAPKGFLGKAKSFGKSLVKVPKDIMMGTGDLMDDPAFWQSAGAVAGMGTSAYMNYRFMKNNPNVYGPFGSPYTGLGTPYGSVNPYLGFGNSRYNPYLGFGSPYGSVNPLGFGSPFLGNPYMNPLGGYGSLNPLGGYGSLNPLGGYGSLNPLGGYGSLNPLGYGNAYGSPIYTGNPFYGSPYGSNPYFPFGTGAGTNLNPSMPLSPFGGLGMPGFNFR